MYYVDWFYDSLWFIGVRRNELEEAIESKGSLLEEVLGNVASVEGEAEIMFLKLAPPKGYREAYIDLLVLLNTVLVRHVKKRYERIEDIEYYTTILGEVKGIETKQRIHSHGEHGSGTVLINWIKDMIEYLQITPQEKNHYTKLVGENVDRIMEIKHYSTENPSILYTVILEGTMEKHPPVAITKTIATQANKGTTTLNYIEEHQRENTQTIYKFTIAQLTLKK